MYIYAQTNLQLYNQLRVAKYSEQALLTVQEGYKLILELFSNRYRANGKSFISHLVGTASILVSQQAPLEVIVAGLLHAVYAQGDFGDRKSGITPSRQAYITQAVSPEIEALIANYTTLPWHAQTLIDLKNRATTLTLQEQRVVLIRLANELEDYLDLGMLYCRKDNQIRKGITPELMVEFAQICGYSSLASQLETIYQQTAQTQIPLSLCQAKESSYTPEVSQFKKMRFLSTRTWTLIQQFMPKMVR